MFVSMAYAEGSAQAAPSAGMGFINMVPLLVIMGIFYFLIIRPQQRKAKQHDLMLQSIKKGDAVLTTGGIYGTIVNIKGNAVEVKIADEVKVLLARNAISSKTSPQTADAQPVLSSNNK